MYFCINYSIFFYFKFYAEFKYVVNFSIRPPSITQDPYRLGKALLKICYFYLSVTR